MQVSWLKLNLEFGTNPDVLFVDKEEVAYELLGAV